jgi:uncharacterized delta-60 repeat protein
MELLESIGGGWKSFMMEPLEARLMLSAALPQMDQDYPFVQDAGEGRVLVAGLLADGNSAMVLRLAADGSLDPTFGSGGIVRLRGLWFVDDFLVQPDGKLLLLTHAPNLTLELYRFDADGGLDPTFGKNGIVAVSVGEQHWPSYMAGRIALQSDGRIVVAESVFGGSEGTPSNMAVTRLMPDGTPDARFGADGSVVGHSSELLTDIAALNVWADGRIAVGVWPAATSDGVFFRYMADGSPDLSLGEGGVAAFDLGTFDIGNWTQLPDGRILSAHSSLRQYRPDGSPDTAFGDNGEANVVGGGQQIFPSSAVLSNGRAIVEVHPDPYARAQAGYQLMAVNRDGSIDTSFGFVGRVSVDEDAEGGIILWMDAAADGSLVEAHAVMSGDRYSDGWPIPARLVVNRFNADGTPVSTFGVNGRAVFDFGPVDFGEEEPANGTVQPDLLRPGDAPDGAPAESKEAESSRTSGPAPFFLAATVQDDSVARLLGVEDTPLFGRVEEDVFAL